MKNNALLVIDLQNGVDAFSGGLFQLEEILSGVNERINVYRKQKRPIIFIQHIDEMLPINSDPWQLFSQLNNEPQDYYVTKTHANSFYHTKLQALLSQLTISHLEICGAQTEYCVDTTIRMAHGLGYQCTMKKGLSTTSNSLLLPAETIIAHHEQLWGQRFLTFI